MDDHETRTDEDIERLAGELHETVRALNRLTQSPPGLTQPAAVYTVLGNLAQTAFRLVQTTQQLDAFLSEELDAGRLGHDQDEDPVPAVTRAHNAMSRAAEQAMDLGETFRRAAGALTPIHAREPSLDRPAEADAKVAHVSDESGEQVGCAGEDFPQPIGDVLPNPGRAEQASAEARSSPQVPHPRRER
ncbi:hypothetical protein [Spirillospora sp. NPDC048823]|uniref:hypothetical protein n=1 Tax=unclassified Spirillospora TaxID=2642701 RepID=UPI0037178DA9